MYINSCDCNKGDIHDKSCKSLLLKHCDCRCVHDWIHTHSVCCSAYSSSNYIKDLDTLIEWTINKAGRLPHKILIHEDIFDNVRQLAGNRLLRYSSVQFSYEYKDQVIWAETAPPSLFEKDLKFLLK